MANDSKISDVRMEAANNGVVISYCEKIEKKGSKSTYDNCSYNYPKLVIQQEDEESTDSMIERAGKEFMKLWKEQYKTMFAPKA